MIVYDAQIDATLDEVSRVCSELHVLASARGGVEWSTEIDLGLTEALSNVVRHGYRGHSGGRITLKCFESAPQWSITVLDQGNPIPRARWQQATGAVFDFDPNDLQSVPEGGMGLSLIRACFDNVDYQSGLQGNCLSLDKLLRQPAA